MELVPGTVIAGRYRLERLLASGGMGAVWVAHHLTLDTQVALKFMHHESNASPAARARFEREARAASLIRHPNVVTVQDYGIEGDTPYMAMELLHGENLDERILRKKRLTFAELEPIVSQISRGLRKAHETGIVHRDLKPQNIFLAQSDDGTEIAKILDFGIAKEIDTTLGQHTKTTELMGSPHYMSPEQLRSAKKSDFRSDLWSLSVIIYRCVTGTIPFPGETLAEVMVQVFSGKWTPPTKLIPGLPPTIDEFFTRALARKPEERYQSIHDLHNGFVAVISGKPLPTPTTTPIPFVVTSPSLPGVTLPPSPVTATPVPPISAPGLGSSLPTPASPSNPGLSAPALERASGPGMNLGFGAPNLEPARPATTAVLTTLPGMSALEARATATPPPTNFPAFAPTLPPTTASPQPALQRPKALFFVAIAAVLVLGLGLFVALRPSVSADKPASGSEATANPATNQETTPIAAATRTALTPDEIAAAVPDETPVEVVSNEPPTPTRSATTQASRSNWKPIPKGQARLLVRAKGGVCKITINATYYGLTPLDAMVDAGKIRVFCRMPTGSTRSKELRAPENRITKIEFDVKQ